MMLAHHDLKDIRKLLKGFVEKHLREVQYTILPASDEALQRLIVNPIIEKCVEAGIVCRTAQQK